MICEPQQLLTSSHDLELLLREKRLPNVLAEEWIQTLSKHWKEINVVIAIQLGRNAQCMDKQRTVNHYSAE